MTTTQPTNIVILGGGYTAVWGYRSLVRRLRRQIRHGAVRITVISASRHHAFHGWTGEVLAGLVEYDRTRTPLGTLMPRAEIVHGRVVAVDTERRTVAYESDGGRDEMPFDHLLVGIGTTDATTRIPGLDEYGWSVKSDQGLLDTHRHLSTVVDRAAVATADERRRLLTVLVAGGGFAGVEMSAAIAERLRLEIRRRPELTGERPNVVLVHRGDALLEEIRPRFDRFADYAVRQLVRQGVDIQLGVGLAAVDEYGAHLADGSYLPAGTVLSTIGQRLTVLPGTEHLLRDVTNRLVADTYLRASQPRIWAGGDAAAVPHILNGRTCPPNALWAIKHGARVGDNIARAVEGRSLRRFRFLGLGQAASFGVGRGAAELGGVQLTGWVGWIARWGFFHWFMPSRRQALGTMGEWLAVPLRGRIAAGWGPAAADPDGPIRPQSAVPG